MVITRSASSSVEATRGRVRITEVGLAECPTRDVTGWSDGMSGQYTLSDPTVLVPRHYPQEMDIFVAHYQGKPIVIARDFVVGSFEILMRQEDVGDLRSVVEGEGLQWAPVSIPASINDVLLNCVRHQVGMGQLICVALGGQERRPTERDYYGLSRALQIVQRIFRVVVSEQDVEAWRITIEEADVAFQD